MQTFEKISNRFWYMSPVSDTDRPILGLVVGENKSLMIDAGNSEAHSTLFLQKIEEHNLLLPSMVVLTHWHWDHIFGLSALDMVSISSKQTKEEMEKLIPYSWSDDALDRRVKEGVEIEFCANAIKQEYGQERNIQIVLPDISIEHRLEIDLGGVTCVLEHVGGDHSPDSVVIYVKEEKILFLGDSIYPDIYSDKRRYTIQNTLRLLEALEKYDAETFILSHWKAVSKEEYEQEVSLLKMVANLTEQFQGSIEDITRVYEQKIKRPLNEDELETIQYFVNGYQS
ncbi:MBL fold metallo-hydrolase [Cytobacillus sp. FJAT-54145]|uniref:MBL fold metallo-hydrolase n=1 Tax=Cytobacillus spartinae TaxID=3299023 RepID=A0ABW6K8I7_9BACI